MAFPDNNRTFTTKVDIQDTIYADHVNVLQTEVRSISEAVNGTDPATNGNILQSTYTGTWTANTTWTSLVARLNNIETGLVNGFASSAYIRKSGGDTIEPASGTIPLTLKTNAGSADLFVTKNSSNANGFRVDYAGIPYVGTAKVIYVGSTEYNNIPTSGGDNLSSFLLGGM